MMSSACKPASVTAINDLMPLSMSAKPRLRGGAARFSNREEPGLGELIDDPITRRLMASDGVLMDHLLQVITEARLKLVSP